LYEWLALAGAAAGVVAVILLVWVSFSLRRIRRSQKVVMGASERDIVQHASSLQKEFIALRDWLDEASGQLDARMSIVEERLDGAIAHTAMLRYDAFGAMSGRQSSSVALLDEKKNGVVLSAIVHRSNSHLYVKQLHEGVSEIDLSPEEKQVVAMAFAEPGPAAAEPVAPQPPRVVTQPVPPPPAGAKIEASRADSVEAQPQPQSQPRAQQSVE
jgi:hypothetical protein